MNSQEGWKKTGRMPRSVGEGLRRRTGRSCRCRTWIEFCCLFQESPVMHFDPRSKSEEEERGGFAFPRKNSGPWLESEAGEQTSPLEKEEPDSDELDADGKEP